VLVSGSVFTAITVSSQAITGSNFLFDNTDISAQKVASILLYNEGAVTIPLSLQISPTSGANYIPDPDYGTVTLGSNASMFIAISNFAHYARLQYVLGASTATISAYYQAQA